MDEPILIYEKSKPGRTGYTLPPTASREADLLAALPAEFRRSKEAALPEVTEGEAVRHFVGLSVKNHHIDKGFYPLGSCTMKYNPKLNDAAAALPDFRDHHPLAPCSSAPGILRLMWDLQQFLSEVSGFPSISLQPVAGAHGEFTGLLIMRAYHLSRGNKRSKVIIPDSAHGTNPASVAAVGYSTVQVKGNERGVIPPEAVAAAMDEDVAGIMMTNPNTLGIFETHIREIAAIVHAKGGLVYMDGANLNANMGIFRPGDVGFDIMHFNLHKTFSTPHGGGGPGAGAVGVTAELDPFLPFPVLEKADDGTLFMNYNRPHSIGRVHAFYGNFANQVRAYAYIKTLGGRGLRRASENAVLNANYLKALLKDAFDLPYDVHCMHEFVLSGNRQKKKGVRTADMSKRMLDFGVHSPTNYFPLIVPEALMIEPTETESRETLDRFAAIMRQIAREADTDPELVTSAPHHTPVRRLDETAAARTLDVCFAE
ncbi:MAG TPA: aminomethyl-transferring glycine dehydrogenase subunit GcvPB [candidate division Zixibacteria bacterium]|nr:aminomethyl-transferring glycine dehydrogenase subunit GcvPB [candidate division Zixibacteria bacterium]MDD4916954.1 aminomethyl-transferring glycine dehydrogenase subunit GcvPB [candidate division Zixibacteria bacterium]MDM7973047.1 aminomethyl-transferring glycine dehydrogenase subunit GcvPB [candidate division Zixibacteria bacterium]HOZ07295.1 aminomethyl-transferring glycine dehydrogenase subunit GcvPB [candidate division Zixibacteria bacterium]HPM36339.1 aminomethyl-transferring glycine